jgi:hypothetical protein
MKNEWLVFHITYLLTKRFDFEHEDDLSLIVDDFVKLINNREEFYKRKYGKNS